MGWRGFIPNERLGHLVARPKVPRRIKWVGRVNAIADALSIGTGVARIPQGPPRELWSAFDARGIGAQEVDVVERRVITCTGQDDEEDQEDSAGSEEERQQGQRGS